MRQTAEATRWGARTARRGGWILAGVAALLLAALGLGGAGGAPAAAQAPRVPLDCAAWTAVTSPNPGTDGNALAAVSAAGAADIWAVGAYTDTGGTAQPLAVHWDGSTWTTNSPPSPGAGAAALAAVHARAGDDVWAVGVYTGTGGVAQTLTEHWNGTAWSQIASPNVGSRNNMLLGVTAVAADDAWAVGYYATSPLPLHTLTLHWNGTTWTTVSAPNPGLGGGLAGITGFGASDVWAVGAYGINLAGDASPLVVHWTGSAWAQVSAPTTGSSALLANVGGVSSGDLWAVGASVQSGTYQTLTEHWTGASWAIVPSPSFGSGSNALGGIAPIGAERRLGGRRLRRRHALPDARPALGRYGLDGRAERGSRQRG